MAGEWLKFESNLPEKPETMAITAAMGWDDTDLTVGKLMRLFRWFDQQTVDGNAVGVTPVLLDKVIGVTGFVQAVINVRWLVVTDNGLALHNFDRHNGETAKSRALTAKRVAKHRSNAQGNGASVDIGNGAGVTSALAKEEKRREEKKKTNTLFERFYAAYPRHVARAAAEKAFDKLHANEALVDLMVAAITKQGLAAKCAAGEAKFVPHPATWLNEARWEDDESAALWAGSREVAL